MEEPPYPSDEASRLLALYRLELLDTPPDDRFDRLTKMICSVLDVPMAIFSLIDKDRQWLKSGQGIKSGLENARHESFCAHTIAGNGIMIVPDATKDKRFFDNPMVTSEPNIVFYMGCPIHTRDGHKIGSLCALDSKPREMNAFKLEFICNLAKLIEMEISK